MKRSGWWDDSAGRAAGNGIGEQEGLACHRDLQSLWQPRCLSGAGLAANQDEIQVYDDSINKPGETGLEVHVKRHPARPAIRALSWRDNQRPRLPGIAGILLWAARDLELGFYLDTEQDGKGTDYFVGTKYRLKWMPVHPDDQWRVLSGRTSNIRWLANASRSRLKGLSCGSSMATTLRTS